MKIRLLILAVILLLSHNKDISNEEPIEIHIQPTPMVHETRPEVPDPCIEVLDELTEDYMEGDPVLDLLIITTAEMCRDPEMAIKLEFAVVTGDIIALRSHNY